MGGRICDKTFYAMFHLIQYVNFQQLLMNANSEANFKVAFESWLKKAFRFIVATD